MKKKWGKALSVLVLTVFSIVLIYGRNKLLATEENEDEAVVIDEAWLIENCDVTKEELEGIDVEHFVAFYNYTAQELQERDVSAKLVWYKEALQWMAEEEERLKNVKNEYAWMFEEDTRAGYKSEYLEDITVIAIRSSSGSYRESVIYDLENQVYYFGELVDVTQDYSQATATGELSDEDVAAIRKLAGEAWIDEWPANSGWVRPRDIDYSTFSMRLAVRDGSVYGYWGERLFPSTFPTFYKEMKDQVGL